MRQPRSGRTRLGGAWILGWVLASGVAHAQAPTAKDHYDRGAKAFAENQYQLAADEFARADEMSPNAVALESALKAAKLADDVELGMTLADRADSRPATPTLTAARDDARAAFQSRAARATIRCPDGKTCALRLPEGEVTPGSTRWMKAGTYDLTADVGGVSTVHRLQVEGGRDLDFQVPAPASTAPATPPPPPVPPPGSTLMPPQGGSGEGPDDDGGLSPVFFWVGLGATVAAGAASAGVGAYTLSLHQDFQDGDDSAEDSGRSAQTATNVLFGVTGAFAIATLVLGLSADWSGGRDAPRAGLFVGPGHAGLGGAW